MADIGCSVAVVRALDIAVEADTEGLVAARRMDDAGVTENTVGLRPRHCTIFASLLCRLRIRRRRRTRQ